MPPRHPARRRRATRAAAAATLLLFAACSERQRPTPVDPGGGMSVEVLAPPDGQSVRPGPIQILVHGHDAIGRMNSLGVLTQSSAVKGGYADSAFARFLPLEDTIVTVKLLLPFLTQATGIELRGVARNATGGEVTTGVRTLIIIPCPPGGCPSTGTDPVHAHP